MLVYFSLFAIVSLSLVWLACYRPDRFFEYPYFMGATFSAFILPQAYALMKQESIWEQQWLADTFLMCSLCVIACWIGYQMRPFPGFMKQLNLSLNLNRLLVGGILFVMVGFIFDSLINALPDEVKGSTWTGIVTIYGFFGTLIYPGFAICLYCALRSGKRVAWLFTFLASFIPVKTALFYGRRESTALFIISLALVLYFVKGWKPPKLAVILCVLAAALLIPTVGEYRSLAQESPWEAFKQLRPLESFDKFSDPGAVMELKNAMFIIAATKDTDNYQYGASYWNQLVFRFVPAQIVGENAKNSLAINGETANPSNALVDMTLRSSAYLPPVGSTVTGIADTYWQFGFFGCLFFAVIGVLFKNLWFAANNSKLFAAQLLYIPMITSAMRAVTHWSIDFLPSIIYSSFFIGLVILYAREPAAKKKESNQSMPSSVLTPFSN